jgi:hypothetical protein
VLFDDPQKEHSSKETSEAVVLVKDIDGELIGFEVVNYLSGTGEERRGGPDRKRRRQLIESLFRCLRCTCFVP